MPRSHATYVAGEQYRTGGRRYDISVYCIDASYYASWFCNYCPTHAETPKVGDQETAKLDCIAAVMTHHAERHAAGA